MPRVFIPTELQSLCGELDHVDLEAANIAQVVSILEERFPGIDKHLRCENRLRPGLAVVVDGTVSSLGLLHKLDGVKEVHFLPAIGGG